jgi:branched-chain amino acid transport system ATP-binding protein
MSTSEGSGAGSRVGGIGIPSPARGGLRCIRNITSGAAGIHPASPDHNSKMHIIKTESITKKFGDFTAVDNVDLFIEQNETVGMIGPNGAGKTTFLNLLTGFYLPDKGTVFYEGKDITGFSPEKRVSLGIVRTFQLVRVFDNLKVHENLGLSYYRKKQGKSFPLNIFVSQLNALQIRERVNETLQMFELEPLADEMTGNLSLGSKRRLEIAMAFIADPKVLALDEPFAGLSDRELVEIISIIKQHRKNQTIFIVEHKISKLLDLVERLVVMHEGRIVASGSPEETLEDPEVRRVYWKVK